MRRCVRAVDDARNSRGGKPSDERPIEGDPAPPPVPRGRFTGPKGSTAAEKVQDQVIRQAGVGPVAGGGGTLFTEPVLVVNQKTQIIELVAEFLVFDQNGTEVGAVVEVGQSMVKQAARLLTFLDQFMTHTFEIRDAAADNYVVQIHRPLEEPLRSLVTAAAYASTPRSNRTIAA